MSERIEHIPRCAHGYGLMRDSCPGCDAEQEREHVPDPVRVKPSWARQWMRRCRRCGLVSSARIHEKVSPSHPYAHVDEPEGRDVDTIQTGEYL